MKFLFNLIFTLFSLYPIFDIRYTQLLYSISCSVSFIGFYDDLDYYDDSESSYLFLFFLFRLIFGWLSFLDSLWLYQH